MTTDAREQIRREVDRRAREQQTWWDEYEAQTESDTDPKEKS